MATIGSLAVNIIATTDKFISGINNAQKQLRKFIDFSGVVRGAIVGKLVQSFVQLSDQAGQLLDLSNATGIATQELDFLKYAAQQAGASFEQVTTGIRELISKGIRPERLEEIAGRLNMITDPAKRARAALEVFGKRAGLSLLPMLRDLTALRKRFAELGGGITQKLAAQLDTVSDTLADAKLAIRNVAATILIALQPAIVGLTDFIATNIGTIRAWIDYFPGITKWLGIATIAVGVLTPVVWGLHQALGAVLVTLAALKAIATSGIIMKLLTLLIANPAVLATLAGVGAIAYGLSLAAPGGETTDDSGARQVREQQRTNDLLSQMVQGSRGGGGGGQVLQIAGVR